jgi:hypothetical protein
LNTTLLLSFLYSVLEVTFITREQSHLVRRLTLAQFYGQLYVLRIFCQMSEELARILVLGSELPALITHTMWGSMYLETGSVPE